MVLLIAPALAGDGVLNGLRGECKHMIKYFIFKVICLFALMLIWFDFVLTNFNHGEASGRQAAEHGDAMQKCVHPIRHKRPSRQQEGGSNIKLVESQVSCFFLCWAAGLKELCAAFASVAGSAGCNTWCSARNPLSLST